MAGAAGEEAATRDHESKPFAGIKCLYQVQKRKDSKLFFRLKPCVFLLQLMFFKNKN